MTDRRYLSVHFLDPELQVTTHASWTGTKWSVAIDGEELPNCCDTIEEAFDAAEYEVARRFPQHSCRDQRCGLWQKPADAT